MEVQIKSDVNVKFSPQGISYVLDMLANCPWKLANPLINDIMNQLKVQEKVVEDGKTGFDSNTPSGGNTSDRDSGVATLEAIKPDN